MKQGGEELLCYIRKRLKYLQFLMRVCVCGGGLHGCERIQNFYKV